MQNHDPLAFYLLGALIKAINAQPADTKSAIAADVIRDAPADIAPAVRKFSESIK